MNAVSTEKKDGVLYIELRGKIDSENAEQVKEVLLNASDEDPNTPVVVDASELTYISSAGLRVILLLRKKHPDISIINASLAVYEVLDLTGFTQMMNVSKAYENISLEDAELIGRGANGKIYRINKDYVVKVYSDADSLEDIHREQEVARLALILGIPTAISYEVVRIDDKYGSVYELLNATSFSKILAREPDKMDWVVTEYVDLLKKIHGTVVPEGKLPDMKEIVLDWAEFMRDYLPEETSAKLLSLIEAVPRSDHMIHGDYHTNNVQLTRDEVLLIDMDTLAVGDPVFEFASIFNAYIGFSEIKKDKVVTFQGISFETALEFWHKVLVEYFGTEDPEVLRAVEDKSRIIGYTRLIRRSIRRNGLEDPERRAEIDHWTRELIDLVAVTDSLTFDL